MTSLRVIWICLLVSTCLLKFVQSMPAPFFPEEDDEEINEIDFEGKIPIEEGLMLGKEPEVFKEDETNEFDDVEADKEVEVEVEVAKEEAAEEEETKELDAEEEAAEEEVAEEKGVEDFDDESKGDEEIDEELFVDAEEAKDFEESDSDIEPEGKEEPGYLTYMYNKVKDFMKGLGK